MKSGLDFSTTIRVQGTRQDRQEQPRQKDQLDGFTYVEDGLYVSKATDDVAIRIVIKYNNNEKLWGFYHRYQNELDTLIREKVAEVSGDLQVKEIHVARGSIILTIVTTALAALATYSSAKEMYQDLKYALKSCVEMFFQARFAKYLGIVFRWLFGEGPDIQFG